MAMPPILMLLLFLLPIGGALLSSDGGEQIISHCDFDETSENGNSSWCGYYQTQSVGDLQWTLSNSTDGNRFAAIEASNTKQNGKARLLSPRYPLRITDQQQYTCLSFSYKVDGQSISLLHALINVYNTTFSSNTQWYVRHPRESSTWTEKQMKVNTSEVNNLAAITELYIRVLFDVTTEPGIGRLKLDNITLSHTSDCDDGGSGVEGETSTKDGDTSEAKLVVNVNKNQSGAALTIKAATDKPDTALSISAKTDR